MPSLTPPIEHRKAILVLAQLEERKYESLKKALTSTVKPEPRDVAETVSTDAATKPIRDVVISLLSMHSVRAHYNVGVPEFVRSVMDGIEFADDPAFSSSELTAGAKRLEELLSIESPISHTSKVSEVATDHGMVFCGCRILTDVRPIFGEDATQEPKEMAIVHNIKIGYHENGRHKEFFISADGTDLKNLKDAIERAEAKEKTLSTFFDSKGVKVSDLD